MGKRQHICLHCSKQFEDYCDTTKYCSRECMNKHKTTCKNVKCPICNKVFFQKHNKQIFCSVKCRSISRSDRIECVCENCGKVFNRKRSEVEKNKHHYCSFQCKLDAMKWSVHDINVMKEFYGKIPIKELALKLDEDKSYKAIKSEAGRLNLTSSFEWSETEIEILKNNYSSVPMYELLQMLPDRTLSSILGKARSYNLKSLYILSRWYTPEQNKYLKDNYLKMTNKELGEELGKTKEAISQHLAVLGLVRPHEKSKYTDLTEYIRGRLLPWINKIKRENNYTCSLSGQKDKVILHHTYGFNLLFEEAIDILSFPIYENINDYSQEQLDNLYNQFFELQEEYASYVCISENVHKQFHSIYGYGDNLPEQWNEFVETYYENVA